MPAGYTFNDFYYILPEIILTAGALLVLIAEILFKKRDGIVFGVTMATLLLTAATVVSFDGVNTTASAGLLAIDGFATFFKVIFLLSAVMTVLMSVPYLRAEGLQGGEYYFLILCATLGMMFMASGVDLITLFIGLETMAISFYILVGFLKPSQRSNEAAVKYFLLGAFSLGVLLYGMSLLYGATGTTNLHGIAEALAGGERSVVLLLAVILVAVGMGFKIAAVPFHMWAPDVYEGAPTPVTAFLSVGSKAASFAMLLRVFVVGLPMLVTDWQTLFWILAAVTMTVGNIAAITQTNTKRMLAYSSIAHAGYLLIGVAAGTERGIAAIMVYLWVYLFMQLGAFAVLAMLRRQEVVGDELKDLSGLFVRKPFAAIAMLIFMLSLGGIPPMGKFWIFGAAIESELYWLAVIGVINSAIAIYYYYRVIVFMWLKEETTGPDIEIGPAMATALGIAVVGSVLFGIYPDAVFNHAQIAAEMFGSAVSTVAQQ